jgi:LacI family transcriptional regulator
MGSRVTIKTVAREAGVSPMTVSRVLNGHPHIADETRQNVVRVMEELGYVPDRNAQTMRTNKTYTIAGVIPDITNPFYPEFERGIQDIADQLDYDLIVYNTDGILAKEKKTLRSLQTNRVDGVIAVFFQLDEQELQTLDVPVVLLAQKPDTAPCCDTVYVDNAAAAQAAVEHLIERGHKCIGMLAGKEGDPPHYSRIAGYRQALAAKGILYDELLVQSGDFTESGGYQSMRELLNRDTCLTAVFAANDLIAMGAMLAIREAGMNIPDDIAVVGFDDIPAAKLVRPPLTTIRHNQSQIGRKAAELLFERLNGEAPDVCRAVEMPYELIVRETT